MGLVRHGEAARAGLLADRSELSPAQETAASETVPADTLLDAWRAEQEPAGRETLIAAIVALRSPQATDALMRIVEEGDAASRSLAILGWQGFPVEEVMRGTSLLESSDTDCRVLAMSVLQAAPGRELERPLIDLLSTETDPNVCAAAIELLSEWGTSAAVEPLLDARRRFAGNEFVEFSIDQALLQAGGGHT